MLPQEFMASIIANKADDLPRMIAADWLEEHGEDERAEFIRVQCEIVKCDRPLYGDSGGYESRYSQLRRRERQLLERLQPTMAFFLTSVSAVNLLVAVGSNPSDFTRGFVSSVECTWPEWLANADAVLKATPLERVRLTTEVRSADCLYEPWQSQWPGIDFLYQRPGVPAVGRFNALYQEV